MGETAFSRLQGRLFCHDPHGADNVIIGRTHRGTIVEINFYVAGADLVIGVGECMPHPIAGYGGGFKLIMPLIKELAEKFNVVHVTEGLTREQVETMKYGYASNLQEAVDRVGKEMPRADVAIFPSGGNIIPEVS